MDERSYHRDNVPAARNLRRRMTKSEALLWSRLRDRGLNGWKLRRQHPVGPYVLDFYCPELRIAIEVDGGIHEASDHPQRDASRQEVIESLGIRFIRISSADVERDIDAVIAMLESALAPSPLPSPIAMGEGDNALPFAHEVGEGAGG